MICGIQYATIRIQQNIINKLHDDVQIHKHDAQYWQDQFIKSQPKLERNEHLCLMVGLLNSEDAGIYNLQLTGHLMIKEVIVKVYIPDGYEFLRVDIPKIGDICCRLTDSCDNGAHVCECVPEINPYRVILNRKFAWPVSLKSGIWAAKSMDGVWFLSHLEPIWSSTYSCWYISACKMGIDPNIFNDWNPDPNISILESKMQKP